MARALLRLAAAAAATAAAAGPAATAGPSATPFQTIPYFDGHFVTVEAEDFHTAAAPSWRAAEWGVDPNYYCGAVFNTYMSRRGYLTAPANATDVAPATATVAVPAAGKWQLLVRYEALNRFDTNFRVTLSQKGVKKLDAVFGLLTNLKIWAYSSPHRNFEGLNGTICGPGLNAVCKWPWGPENQLWEGLGNSTMSAEVSPQRPEFWPREKPVARKGRCHWVSRRCGDSWMRGRWRSRCRWTRAASGCGTARTATSTC